MATVPPSVPRTPGRWSEPNALEDLRARAQAALILELHTIPLYLYPLYSIKEQGSHGAKVLRGIVQEEMLHMALAGNILRAIGGAPKLVGPDLVPVYPAKIFKKEDTLHLDGFSKDNINTFRRLERPQGAPSGLVILHEYDTIGAFYRDLEEGLQMVEEIYQQKNPPMSIFDNGASAQEQQFTYDDMKSEHMKGLVIVKDLEGALSALKLIVDQGEGGPGAPEGSHYSKLDELWKSTEAVEFYPVKQDLKTNDDKHMDESIHKVMVASDAVYTYLLMTIEAVWRCDGSKSRKTLSKSIKRLMRILTTLANFLVTQPLKDDGNAAPPFGFCELAKGDSAYKELSRLVGEAANAYSSELEQVVKDVGQVCDLDHVG